MVPPYTIRGYPRSTRLGRFGPPIEVICLLCSSAHLSSCLWSTNVDKSSSIWLPRSRYCRTIQKNTCAAIVGRLGRSSRLSRFGPPIEVICQLCSSVVYGTLTWTSLHRSGYPDPGIVGPYTNVTKKESLDLCSYCRTARSLVTARSHRFRHGSVALVLPSKSFASYV